ncbi:MAG TPA: hypothetical protein VF627_12370, partial [Abditibacterium sp.]
KWDEMGDFHKRSSKNESGSTHTVETTQGNFEFGLEGDGKAIAKIIARRAINAPVREWEVKGERLTDEWPRRFEFYQPSLDSGARNAFFVLLAFLGLTAYLLLFRLQPRGDLATSVWFLAYVGPILLLPLLPALIWLFLFSAARQARPFRGQSVEVSPTGIVFNGPTRSEATWAQIEAWNWIRRGRTRFLQLKTVKGEFEIPSSIAGFAALCRIMERFSGVSIINTQNNEDSIAAHPIEIAPDETLVFSFNDLGVQTMTWLFLPMGAIMFFTPFLMRWADPQAPPRDEIGFLISGVALFLLSLGWWWFLRVARLHVTRDALEWRGPLLHRVVAWKDFESYGSTPNGSYSIVAKGRKVPLSWMLTMVPQRSRLREEIAKRAFNATGEWQEKSLRKH